MWVLYFYREMDFNDYYQALSFALSLKTKCLLRMADLSEKGQKMAKKSTKARLFIEENRRDRKVMRTQENHDTLRSEQALADETELSPEDLSKYFDRSPLSFCKG